MADTLRPIPSVTAPVQGGGGAVSPTWFGFFQSLANAARRSSRITYAAANPTTADIADGDARLWKNTTSGQVRLWANDGGTLRSVQLT